MRLIVMLIVPLLGLGGCNVKEHAAGRDLAPDLWLPDATADRGVDSLLPDTRQDGLLDALDQDSPPPCVKSPCAARPIIFVHGFMGSNSDWFKLLKGFADSDARYDGHHLSGVLDHASWAPRSKGRRSWLFAFDYYINKSGDGRGSYTAGPGRIGSKTAHVCASPAGNGYIVADSSAYDAGANRDYAADLASFVHSVLSATGASEVDLVAHSMGGLIVRSYLSFYGGASRVQRVMFLASPVKGLSLAGFLAYFPIGQPSWMKSHEVAELDGGSVLSKIRFYRCGEGKNNAGAWGQKLLDQETLSPPSVEFHCMTAQLDFTITYAVGHHPMAKSHQDVSGAGHEGILSSSQTLAQVKKLLGGSFIP